MTVGALIALVYDAANCLPPSTPRAHWAGWCVAMARAGLGGVA